ncbi:MAG: hypothetical protein AB7T07_04505 [Steroidobacteraceae bacterium]
MFVCAYRAWQLWCCILLPSIGGSIVSNVAHSTSVYECIVNGQRMFSDQRCAADARQREIDTPNRMVAQDTTDKPATTHPPRRSNYIDLSKQRLACNRIRDQIDTVHSHMRSGYNGTQGERLNERLRKLNDRYAQQRCDRVHR